MDSAAMLAALKDLAEKLGVAVSERSLAGNPVATSSGLCRVRDKDMIILDRRLPVKEKVEVMAQCLGPVVTDEVYVVPAVRDLLSQYTGSGSGGLGEGAVSGSRDNPEADQGDGHDPDEPDHEQTVTPDDPEGLTDPATAPESKS